VIDYVLYTSLILTTDLRQVSDGATYGGRRLTVGENQTNSSLNASIFTPFLRRTTNSAVSFQASHR